MTRLLTPQLGAVVSPVWNPVAGPRGRRRASAGAIPSYAEFVAAETARATSGDLAWSATLAGVSANNVHRTTCAAAAGFMYGSPWSTGASVVEKNNSNVSRLVQHCFPSEAVFNAQVAAGRMVTFTIPNNIGAYTFAAVDRNGYLSQEYLDPIQGLNGFADFRYYDPVLGPVKMNPQAGTGPTPYALGT